MNVHVELVKKWLADKDSVSQEEILHNLWAAEDAEYEAESNLDAAVHLALCAGSYEGAISAYDNEIASKAAVVAAKAATKAASTAARAAMPIPTADEAARYVKKYEDLL